MREKTPEEAAEELQRAYKDLQAANTRYDKGAIRERIRKIEKNMPEATLPLLAAPKVTRFLAETNIILPITPPDTYFNLSECKDKNISITPEKYKKEYESADISKVSNITINSLQVTGSCTIKEANNSCFYLCAQQIRLFKCYNITLYAYTRTGIYIEQSENVKVLPYEMKYLPSWPNCLNLYDFSKPAYI